MTTLPAAEPAGLDTDTFLKGLWRENPVFVQVLGMCPVLAVSNTAMNGLAMGLAATFVLVMSSTLVSLLRNVIPKQVRIATFILIIATFVTIVDFLIQAISLDVHKALGAFIALIVVNCIILGRAEAFASKNSLVRSVLDAAGMGLGFTFALLCLGVVREVLGSGTLLPGGGFFTLGLWLLLFAGWSQRRQRRQARQEA
jgi:electron transport complex protein RnfE